MITETQAKIMAAALHEIRPAWSVPSMMTLLGKNKDHPATFADTLAAAVNAARDHAVTTPALIFIDQRFWPEEVKKRLPKPPECADHTGQDAHNCSSCWADVKCLGRPESHIGKHWTPPPTMYEQLKNTPEALALAGASTIPTEET